MRWMIPLTVEAVLCNQASHIERFVALSDKVRFACRLDVGGSCVWNQHLQQQGQQASRLLLFYITLLLYYLCACIRCACVRWYIQHDAPTAVSSGRHRGLDDPWVSPAGTLLLLSLDSKRLLLLLLLLGSEIAEHSTFRCHNRTAASSRHETSKKRRRGGPSYILF